MTPLGMSKVLIELELVSHGTTQAWNSAGGAKAKDTIWEPPGESNPPHLEFRVRWQQATSLGDRARVYADAVATLKAIRGVDVDRSHVVGETLEQENKRILKQGRGETADRVALAFHCTPTRVRKVRLAAGVSVEDGRGDLTASATTDDAAVADAERVRHLREHGMSIRAIAMAIGKPKSTVHDILAAA